MNKSNNKSLIKNMSALLLGCIIGCTMNLTGYTGISHVLFAPLGSFYLRVLQFVALPMIFCLVVVSITSFPDIKKIISLFIETIVANFATAFFALLVTFCVATFFVSKNYLLPGSSAMSGLHVASALNYIDKLMNLMPSNFVGNFMQKYLLIVLIISVLLGVLVVQENAKLDFIARIAASLNSILKRLLEIVVHFAPIGVFVLSANAFASNDLAILKTLVGVIGMTSLSAILSIALSIMIVSFMTKRSCLACFKAEAPAIFFAFATCSTPACVPLVQEGSEELGCGEGTSSFVAPVTKMLIKAGGSVCIYSLLAFIIVASGYHMPFYMWVYMIFVTNLCSLASPAIPMGSVFVVPTALGYLGKSVDENLMGLVIATYIFLDMFGSAVTCSMDVFSAVLVEKFESRKKKSC